jgi:hypothetical protein
MGNILKYKLFESWSEDYTLDFSDHGFEMKEIGNNLKGKFKGKFIISDLNLWYSELIDRLNSEYEITTSKHSFSTISGVASFEIDIIDKKSRSFSVFVDKEEFKLYADYISIMSAMTNRFSITLQCKTESGSKKPLKIWTSSFRSDKPRLGSREVSIQCIIFQFGSRRVKVHIKPDQLENLIKILRELKTLRGDKTVDMSHSEKLNLEAIINGNNDRISLVDAINNRGNWDRKRSAYIINQ